MEGLSNLTGNRDLRRRKLEGGGGDLPERELGVQVNDDMNRAVLDMNESELGEIVENEMYNLSPVMANKGKRLVHTPREQALRELLDEAKKENIFIQSDDEAQAFLDWAAKREGVPPENYHAVAIGDTIMVRPEYVENVRILREEMIHVFQQRSGQSSLEIVSAEIEARLEIIRQRHKWGITNDEVRQMISEIRQMRATGRY